MADEPANLPAVPGDVSYEVELDDPPDTRPVLVDAPEPPAELRPAFPPQWRAAPARAARRNLHRARGDSLSSPSYLLQALALAVVGVLRPALPPAGRGSGEGGGPPA